MAEILTGAPVAKDITQNLLQIVEDFDQAPQLAIVRIGENPGDVSYERAATNRAHKLNCRVKQCIYPQTICQQELEEELRNLDANPDVHGILLLRPLPKHLDESTLATCISAQKDLDGMTEANIAKVFASDAQGFAPCTPEAVLALCDYYNIDMQGKHVVVVGRSRVVGKPLALLCLHRHATVTICHSHTENLSEICKNADILVSAVGKARFITQDMLSQDAYVIDVGVNEDEDGSLTGDVFFDRVEPHVKAITPVPRGVGSVTTSILMRHLIEAYQRQTQLISG